MYTDLLMDHFADPRNAGEIAGAGGVGQACNPVCGDVMRVTITVDGRDRIEDVKSKVFGCGAAVAASSMVTELAMGKSLREALGVSDQAVADALGGLPRNKLHCAHLAAEALHLAVLDFLVRSGREDEVDRFPLTLSRTHQRSSR